MAGADPRAGHRQGDHHREREGGNQLTSVDGPSVSHVRAAAAISTPPVDCCGPSEIELCALLQPMDGQAAVAPVGDRRDRTVEAHAHVSARGDRHPVLGHLRDGRVQREVLGVPFSERPTQPSRSAHLDVHGHHLARS